MAKLVKETHENWLKCLGKKGQKHNDSNIRLFQSKPVKHNPEWFTQELIDSFKNNINILKEE